MWITVAHPRGPVSMTTSTRPPLRADLPAYPAQNPLPWAEGCPLGAHRASSDGTWPLEQLRSLRDPKAKTACPRSTRATELELAA